MPIVANRYALVALDEYDNSAELGFPPIDKLDLTAYNGDVRFQYYTPQGWQPSPEGVKLTRGRFRSIPGLAEVYPPGPTGVRFKRATAGVAATVDVEAYSAEDREGGYA